MRWFFKQFDKEMIRKSVMETFFFFAFTGQVACKTSHNSYSVYYNLQEPLHTWSLSNIEGFSCH